MLTEKEEKVIRCRYSLDGCRRLTQEEIGQMKPFRGLTRERIRQIEQGAIEKMRRELKRSQLFYELRI